MPDWLHHAFFQNGDVEVSRLTIRLGMAFIMGCVVGGVYRLTHGKGRDEASGMLATLVLLTVLIAVVTQVIGDNQARAFSLVGALAVVRFRTVVEDTRDTAFVIFAVAMGMALGAGFLVTPIIGLVFATTAAFLFRPNVAVVAAKLSEFSLMVRVGLGHNAETILREPLREHVVKARLDSSSTARSGAAVDLNYTVELRSDDSVLALVSRLNGIEGIQSVELRRK
jgi:uncharacterized membrane protein YhiD involved in acid resistance